MLSNPDLNSAGTGELPGYWAIAANDVPVNSIRLNELRQKEAFEKFMVISPNDNQSNVVTIPHDWWSSHILVRKSKTDTTGIATKELRHSETSLATYSGTYAGMT